MAEKDKVEELSKSIAEREAAKLATQEAKAPAEAAAIPAATLKPFPRLPEDISTPFVFMASG